MYDESRRRRGVDVSIRWFQMPVVRINSLDGHGKVTGGCYENQRLERYSSRILSMVCLCLSAGTTVVAAADAGQITDGQKAIVKGVVVSRHGNPVQIQEQKSDQLEFVKLSDSTRIERQKGKVVFFSRYEDIGVTALVPGLTIAAEGVGNKRIGVDPD